MPVEQKRIFAVIRCDVVVLENVEDVGEDSSGSGQWGAQEFHPAANVNSHWGLPLDTENTN